MTKMTVLDELENLARAAREDYEGPVWYKFWDELSEDDLLHLIERVRVAEARIDRWMLLVGKGVEDRMTAEAERDAAVEFLEAVNKLEAQKFDLRLERDAALARIADLEEALSKECRDLASTSVHTAAAMGSLRLTMGEAMVKLGYEGLRQKLSRAEAHITEAAKLHQRLVAPNGFRWCAGCSTDEYPGEWPCPTAIALGLNEGEER